MACCIICGTGANLTDEHVFLDALGGTITLKDGSCKSCNNAASREFEGEFVRSFALFRSLLDIEDRRGNVPKLRGQVELEGQKHPAVVADGQIQIRPIKIEHEKPDGTKDVFYRAFSKEDNRALLESLTSKGFKFESAPVPQPAPEVEANVHVSFDFIGRACGLRTATKAAYTALALKAGSGFILSGSFESAREYIRHGTGSPSANLFLNANFQKNFHIGPHQHAIVCAGDAHKRRVHAVVVFFGGLFYRVRLCDDYRGADFCWTIACNAQKGEESKLLVSEFDNEFRILEDIATGGTSWDDLKGSAGHLMHFFTSALDIKFAG